MKTATLTGTLQLPADRTALHSSRYVATAAIAALPFVLAIIGLQSGFSGHDAWYSEEDGLAENLQVVFLLLGSIAAVLVARHRGRDGERLLPLLYVGLAIALFFVAGEEISWGQRLLGIETPPEIAATNVQHELNVHNSFLLTPVFSLAQLVLGGGIMLAALVPWGAFLPQALDGLRQALVPGPALAPYFGMSAAWRLYRYDFLYPGTPAWVGEMSEVPELILYLGLCLFTLDQVRRARRTRH